jgi:RNA polymerase sigma-70 factor (ECF subfamily)
MITSKPREIGRFNETDLVLRASRRDEVAIRAIIKQHNGRLFRLARSVLRDEFEAEDAVQETYLKAFSSIANFREESSLATWLSRIVLNECLQRLRSKRSRPQSTVEFEEASEAQIIPFPQSPFQHTDPEKSMAQRELLCLVEKAVDELPDDFRVVLVARTIEGMSVEETAELLGLRTETVKTRLFRARKLLKESLAQQIDPLLQGVFPFLGRRCENMADKVLERLRIN